MRLRLTRGKENDDSPYKILSHPEKPVSPLQATIMRMDIEKIHQDKEE